jgi:2-haloalkanoic acid dehalogenase type II
MAATVKALTFDCYGTLIDWEAGILAALRPWRQRTGVGSGDADFLAAFARHESAVEEAQPRMLYPEVLGEVARRLGREFGQPMTSEEARTFGASVPDWPAFPDSPEALRRLGRRARLIILSNVDRRGFAGSNAKLGVDFHAVLTAEDVGSYKPSPRNFAYLLGFLKAQGVAPDALLHVAQSLRHDHAPAKAIGIRTCWIDRQAGKTGATGAALVAVSPDMTFPTLAAFADAVEAGKVSGL